MYATLNSMIRYENGYIDDVDSLDESIAVEIDDVEEDGCRGWGSSNAVVLYDGSYYLATISECGMQFSIRKFEGSSFGEAHHYEHGESIADFEDYVEKYATGEIEDEPARPFRGVIAGRQWTDSDGVQWSAFAKEEDK